MRAAAGPPVWGHVQFDATHSAGSAPSLLYMNWQPHYAAGFIDFQRNVSGGPGQNVACCVLLRDHGAGPHDEQSLAPTIDATAHDAALQRTFADAKDALEEVGAGVLAPPHWLGQVRFRRCAIYFALMALGCTFAFVSAWGALADLRRFRRGSTGDSFRP